MYKNIYVYVNLSFFFSIDRKLGESVVFNQSRKYGQNVVFNIKKLSRIGNVPTLIKFFI